MDVAAFAALVAHAYRSRNAILFARRRAQTPYQQDTGDDPPDVIMKEPDADGNTGNDDSLEVYDAVPEARASKPARLTAEDPQRVPEDDGVVGGAGRR